MHDNKIRLSPDVIEKAELIASEWGLKNARAAVEAVFRRYADDYRNGRSDRLGNAIAPTHPLITGVLKPLNDCEALNELDDLLGL